MTTFLSLLYSGAREGDFLNIVKKVLFFLISWIISIDNHRRFHLLGNEALGMHLYISRKALHQSFQEIYLGFYQQGCQRGRGENCHGCITTLFER